MTTMQRFNGEIAGLGTPAGTRVMLGVWRETPFGPIAHALIEREDSHRFPVAPNVDLV